MAAVLSLSGDALAWFWWTNQQAIMNSWEEMKEVFLKRFRPIHGGDLYEQWAALRQTGTAEEYVRRFIDLSATLEGVTERIAMGNFIDGLQDHIKTELRLWTPDNLGRAIDLAQHIEERSRSFLLADSSRSSIWVTPKRLVGQTRIIPFLSHNLIDRWGNHDSNTPSQKLKYKIRGIEECASVVTNAGSRVMCVNPR